MKRALRWAGFAIAGFVVILGLALGVVYFLSQSRMDKTYHVTPSPLMASAGILAGGGSVGGETDGNGPPGSEEADTDPISTAVARGEHLAVTRGCTDCHGADLGGAVFADDMPVFRISGSNLTPGGVGAFYSDEDWVRSIRHGVRPDERPLLFMPSYEFYYLSDDDVASLIEYFRSLPPVERDLRENSVGPLGRILFLTGKLPLLPAEMIDHEGPRPESPPPGVTIEYGAYLAVGCSGCHGETLSGGPIPGVPPEWPEAANITPDPATGIGRWSRDDFFRALREGMRPDGTELRGEFMPWPNLKQMKDDELEALWMYLSSLEGKPYGGR